jgi:hypothetical protein
VVHLKLNLSAANVNEQKWIGHCTPQVRVLQGCRHDNLVQLKRVVTGSKLDR